MIRLANKGDVYAIKEMVNAHIHHFSKSGVAPSWVLETLTYNQFVKRLKDNHFLHYVCEIDQKIVGYLALNQQHVYHLFVDSMHQKQGIAKRLWETFLSETSFKSMTVRSSLSAVGFYEQLGFVKQDIQHYNGLDFCNMIWETQHVP